MKNRTLVIAAVSVLQSVLSLHADEPMHPVLTISGSGSGASTVTNIAESAYTNNFIPRTPPRNNSYGFVPAVVSGDSGWSWSSSAPNQITSTPSLTVFPNTNTTAYPIRTQAVTVFLTTATNNLTKSVNAIYYNKAGSTTSKSLVFNLIDYYKLDQLRSDLNKLAPAYINSGSTPTTRNDNYARRIAVSLLDWARWHPSYYLTGINSASYINVTTNYQATTTGFGPQRASDHNGLAHEWQDDELLAFDAIYNSVALTNLSAEMGFDVRQYICDNLFFDEGDFFVNHIPISIAIQSNLSGPYAVLPEVARVLNRPDYIYWMDAYLDATVRQKIRRDGALEEGMGYSIGYLNSNQDAAQNTRDYFITRAATNSDLLAISNRASVYNLTFQYGQAQWATIALPNGQLPSFGDTPFNTYFTARNNGNSAILPAYGTLSMGVGSSSSTAVQVNQQYSGNNNHMRADTAAYVLWAFGNEYLGNIRYYNGSVGRDFGEQMLAYNTITIDRANETFPDADTYGNANLTVYEPGNSGLAMTELDGYRDYSNKASRFQRLLFLNTVDLAKPYIVDVFRVTGGTTHDYTFHGAIRWDQNAQCSFPLVTNPAPYPMLEGSETWDPTTDTPFYGFWRNVNSNNAPGDFQLLYTDTNRATGRDTKLWMTADPNAYNVYLGTTPVPARDNTTPTNFFNNLGLKRPSAIIRHRVASGPLQDLFVSVVEPFNAGVSNIVSVQRLPMSGSSLESCALKITFKDGRADTYVVNLRNPKIAGANTGSAIISTGDGQYALNGRAGLHVDRTNDSRVWTVDATDFKYPGRELSTPAATYYTGWIAGETRKQSGGTYDAFTTTTPLPTGTSLRNKFLSLTHGTLSGSGTTNVSEMYRIDQVVLSNGLYYICFTNDHYLEITNGITSVEQVAPLRTFTTSNSFEIVLTAFAGQISPIADRNIPPNGSSGPIAFTFGNLGTTAGASLQVLATSSNQVLVPNGNLVLGGSGTNRTLTVTPIAGQTGTSLITVAVTDGVWTNSRTFNVVVANFALTTSPGAATVFVGNSTWFTNVVVATNGTGSVNFNVSGLPANCGATFTPATTVGSGTNVLSITTSNTTLPGTYPLTVVAASGSQSATSTVALVVNIVSTPGWTTWTGGSGSTAAWSDAANWSPALTAGNSLAFSGVTRLNNTNDTAAGTIYSNIVFNPGAGAFTLYGNAFTLVGGITNNSSVSQTVALGINFNNSIAFNGASNQLLINGGLTNTFGAPGSTTLTLAGAGQLKNVLKSTANPGGTNIVLLNSASANWTLTDNDTAAAMTVPWVFSINNGTFNFGGDANAPTLTTTTPNNVPQDNQVGTVTGGTAVFNMVDGTLTTSARFNTATAVNSTGIVNQVGGTMNIGNQFQGANGANAGELSIVNISGGVMNIGSAANPTSPFYVASRGSGILNVSDTGVLNCGKLDISRNANGNSVSSSGTVNLSGGALCVTSVTNISANQQTSGSPTATFNFNGGTLVAKYGSASMFFQGSTVTPITPIRTYVKAGGAIIDDGGNAITIGEPLQHDTGLGNAADGGLTKNGAGTLSLVGTNTYSGDTAVNSGTLSLIGNASISNSANILLAPGATLNASTRTDGKLNVVANQTIAGSGSLIGNVFLNGAISPGADTVNTITNIGSVTFGSGGGYLFDMADALGQPGTNWDLLEISGALDIQATTTNPFTIYLRSVDTNLNDGVFGASDFGSAAAQSWLIAEAAAVSDFTPNKFSVDSSAFQNDLTGGYFTVQTNSDGLAVAFIPNNAPSADDAAFYLPPGGVLHIPISSLAQYWSDPDGDLVQFLNVNSNSASGSNNVSYSGGFIDYTNQNGSDTLTYTVGDIRTNPPAIYRSGDTRLIATGTIYILPPPPLSSIAAIGGQLVFGGSNGWPDGKYYVLSSSNLMLPMSNWARIATNYFDDNGNLLFTNPMSSGSQQFYRLLVP